MSSDLMAVVAEHLDQLGFKRCYSFTQWKIYEYYDAYIVGGTHIDTINSHGLHCSISFWSYKLGVIFVTPGTEEKTMIDLHRPDSFQQLDDLIFRE